MVLPVKAHVVLDVPSPGNIERKGRMKRMRREEEDEKIKGNEDQIGERNSFS